MADILGLKGHGQSVGIPYYNYQAGLELVIVDQGKLLDHGQSFDTLSAGKDAL